MTCSPGLLWNGIKNECDFPENVDCNLSPEALAKHKVVTKSLTNFDMRVSNVNQQHDFSGFFWKLHLHDF